MRRKLVTAILVASIISTLFLGATMMSTKAATAQTSGKIFLGISGYPTSTSQIDSIISTMETNGLNTYRMSFNPQWAVSTHPYQQSYVQYFLDHSNFNIIVDRNHLYPPTETSATTARNNWATVENSLMEVLRAFPNNPRVMVELINEYVSSDYYPRMQALVDDIRAAGYTNQIVVDKWNQAWTVINDPLDATYQGYHFYFNSWSVSGAISQMQTAQSKGIKLINTEVGADFNEYSAFTTSTVTELNQFLSQCANMGIGNTVWMNQNLNNMPTYQQLGLQFPTVTAPTTSPAPTPSPTSTPTPTPSPSPNPSPTPSPTPTPTPPPATPPPSNVIFQDSFESGSTSKWTSTTRTNGDTVSVTTSLPYSGSYNARFYTSGSTTSRENAFLRKSISMSNAYASASFRILSSTSGTQFLQNDNDRFYLLRFTNNNGNDLALAGIKRENGVNKWVLFAGNTAKTSSSIAVSPDKWYSVELHWNSNIAELYVNGAKILSITTTGNGSTATYAEMGILYTYSVQNRLLVYGDNYTLSNTP